MCCAQTDQPTVWFGTPFGSEISLLYEMSFFQVTLSAEGHKYIEGFDNVFYNYATQRGTRRIPARSCRDLHLDYPDYPSGK